MPRRDLLIGPDVETAVRVAAEFTDDEWSILGDFHTFAQELAKTALLKGDFSFQVGFAFASAGEELPEPDDSGGQTTRVVRENITLALDVGGVLIRQKGSLLITASVPPKDDLRAALHLARPMILQSERTEFSRVCNIIGRRVAHPDIRDRLTNLRDLFNGRLLQSAYQMGVGSREDPEGLLLNTETAFVTWLNGFEYHRDPEKRKRLESLHQFVPLEASEVIFVQLFGEKLKAIFGLAELTEMVLGHSDRGEIVIQEYTLAEPDPGQLRARFRRLFDEE